MRIPCPFCGDRDAQEFAYRGDAAPVRPDCDRGGGEGGAGEEGFYEYLYLRDNRAGPMREHWYHAQGCRNWLVVTRDTRTHEVFAAELARADAR